MNNHTSISSSLLSRTKKKSAASTISSRIPAATAYVEQKIETISVEWYRWYDWNHNVFIDDAKQSVQSEKIATYVYPHDGANTNIVSQSKQRYDRR